MSSHQNRRPTTHSPGDHYAKPGPEKWYLVTIGGEDLRVKARNHDHAKQVAESKHAVAGRNPHQIRSGQRLPVATNVTRIEE